MSVWSSDFVRPDVAAPSSAPPRFVRGFRPAPPVAATLAGASASSLRFEIIRPTPGHPRNRCLPLTLAHVGCVEDFHLQVSAPCRAHQKKDGGPMPAVFKS